MGRLLAILCSTSWCIRSNASAIFPIMIQGGDEDLKIDLEEDKGFRVALVMPALAGYIAEATISVIPYSPDHSA